MDVVFTSLAETYPLINFTKVEAEEDPALSAQHAIEVVPTFLFLFEDGSVAFKVEGVNPPEVARCAELLAEKATAGGGSTPSGTSSLDARLRQIINTATMMVMIKGTVDAPKCKFSRELVDLLKEEQIQFGAFNILTDEDVRQGLKSFSDWPTYPQIYVKGELVGGLDILKEMRAGGDLKKELGLVVDAAMPDFSAAPPPPNAPIEVRLKQLISSSRVMLFMKGSPDEPQCGFSRKTVGILREGGFTFGHFDILSDEDVRQGLKKYSNWPTFPQLYIDSELIGGLDIIDELVASGEFSALK